MKLSVMLAVLAACGGSNNKSEPDAPTGSGGGSGVPMACAITVSSAQIMGSTNASVGGTCTPSKVNNTTIAIDFMAMSDATDEALAEISCIITPNVVPQTLGIRGSNDATGCHAEIDYMNTNGSATSDSWTDTSNSTIDIVLTDIPTASGTISMTLYDSMNASMTVSGTF
jgi:hypothetical protein